MKTVKPIRLACIVIMASTLHVSAANLKTMNTGLGTGAVMSSPAGINCGADCDESYGSSVSVTLTASAASGSTFTGWEGDCAGTAPCTLAMNVERSVRAGFRLNAVIPTISQFSPESLATYLSANPTINTPARFVQALPRPFKQNWILMEHGA